MFLSLALALKNYRREWLFSVCAVFSLTAFLVPLLTLMGVKDGVVDTLTRRLVENPRVLELTPKGEGQFPRNFFQELNRHPDTAFSVPETRSLSASIQLQGRNDEDVWLDLSSTASGDPLMRDVAAVQAGGGEADGLTRIILTERAAEKTGLQAGDQVEGRVSRNNQDGQLESAAMELMVAGIMPAYVDSRDRVYCRIELMEMTEDYRNGYAVPALGWPGLEKPARAPRYASFRLYARSIDGVERLRMYLAGQDLVINTNADGIATVRTLEHSFTVVFLVLATVVGLGAFASIASSAMDQVAKMRRSLAVLRLLGFNSGPLMIFIMAQAALTGLLAAAIADGLFLSIAGILNAYFGASTGLGERVCWLSPEKLALAAVISIVFMLAASVTAGFSLSNIEPAEGMRDV